jgi:MFS family permease
MNSNPGQAESTAESARPTNVRWLIVGLLFLYSFMSWFNRVSISVAYDEQMKDQLGIAPQAMGVVYSAMLIAYMVCMTPGGLFADRRGPWFALVFMGFGSGLFVILSALPGWLALSSAGAVALFLVVRTAMGICTAPIYPASCRIVAHWLPFRQRARVNGQIMAAALVGIASTYYGFGILLDLLGWPTAFAITGGLTILLGLLWTGFATNYPWQHQHVNEAERLWIEDEKPVEVTNTPDTRIVALTSDKVQSSDISAISEASAPRLDTRMSINPGAPEASLADSGFSATPLADPSLHESSWWSLLRNRSLILLTLSYAAVGYFEYLFYFWMHYYFEDVLHLGKDTSRAYATVGNLSMAVGMGVGGLLSDRLQSYWGYRLGRAIVPVGGMLAGALLLLLGIMAREPIWIVIWIALAMAAVGTTEGPFWATAIDLGGRHGATSAGIFNTGGNAGGALAPIFTPLIGQHFGWGWGIGVGAVVCLVGVSFWFWIDPAER